MKNPLIYAYLGDSIYDFYIRKNLIDTGICKVNDLQREAVKYVSAKGQAMYLKILMDENKLTEEELNIVKLARNHKSNHKPKGCDIITYKHATALEALIGYLYYKNSISRIEEILDYILKR